MNPDLSIINFQSKWFKLILLFFTLVIATSIIFLLYQGLTQPKTQPVDKAKGQILILYSLTSLLWDRINLNEFTNELNKNSWQTTIAIPNKNSPDTWLEYDSIIIFIPTTIAGRDYLLTNYLNSLKEVKPNKEVILISSNHSSSKTTDKIAKLSSAKGGIVINTIENKNSNSATLAQEIAAYYENYLINLDKNKLDSMYNLASKINNYYSTSGQLPDSIEGIKGIERTTSDSNENIPTKYFKINSEIYRLCNNFSWNFSSYNTNVVYSNISHSKGYGCYLFNVWNAPFQPPQKELLKEVSALGVETSENINRTNIKTRLANGSFEQWNEEFIPSPKNWSSINATVTKNKLTENEEDQYAIEILPNNYAFIISENLAVLANKRYKASIFYNTESNCESCSIIGMEIYDEYNKNLSRLAKNCGLYDSKFDMIYKYIESPKQINTQDLEMVDFSCEMPINSNYIKLKFGFKSNPIKSWLFDNANFEELN